MKQIFPKEIIENSVEVHQFKHSNKSKIIFSIILLALIISFISLRFIKITIYNNSQGIIRADKERILLNSSGNGKVVFHQLKNNLQVYKGDTLLVLNNFAINQKIENTIGQIEETKTFINDLKLLITNKILSHKPTSLKYQQEINFYKQKLNELNTRFRKIREDYKRNNNLFKKGVIAKITLSNSRLEYDLALNAISQYKKQQFSTWQNQMVNYQNQLKELQTNKTQLKESNNLSIIKSPTTGTLLNVKGIENGSFITKGFQLAEISPKTDLIVECYINPNNIGLLKKDHKVNFQVSTFNYNQWGLATGNIIEIGNDVQIVNNTPVFKVLCSLNQNFLQLKNGFKGQLKKGMLVNARFELTKRTLFDLLYDKMDDWLNPSTQISKK
ncbi:HlyD family efflux transporter periplasmic adaptor subunit [Tenacibaculum aiptasiae]|uniref:HlyD family efflux transporter periplasmic adaptor subunit n=1 Tax=Tenacibaculum aiptasiae TaxID=426481 RepID=A0A7J5ASJ3_9FLAO|nr:HlyD family secretion protein [Tenacibaculum aiptasiae]KAB1160598.1 HlyD family efflux transporter periplasmic adaptor subunit [Tenacibaculum aiptasiae]